MINGTRPSPSILAYCKRSKSGWWEGLGKRLDEDYNVHLKTCAGKCAYKHTNVHMYLCYGTNDYCHSKDVLYVPVQCSSGKQHTSVTVSLLPHACMCRVA